MNKINSILAILLISCFYAVKSSAQTYLISTEGSVSTCSGNFFDSGGNGANYANNENYTMTFCSNSSNCLRISFSLLNFAGDNGDKIKIYDGPTTAYAMIDNFNGANVPAASGGSPYVVTSTSGCITIKFTSDGGTVAAGFAGAISCVACPATPSYDNPAGFVYTCNALFFDNGGSGAQYGNNQNKTTKICSSGTDCVRASFSSFATENGIDILTVYDGPNTSSPVIGTYSGNTSPGVVTSTTGCLTFNFQSDGSVRGAGWASTISCVPCGTPPTPSPQNCSGAVLVCNDQSFSGNSNGSGSINDLTNGNDGCLSGENQSSWYYFTPLTSGTVQLAITPQNGTDDYDFAMWEMNSLACPPPGAPDRCSFAAGGGITGLSLAVPAQNSEGAGGDRLVSAINVTAGKIYLLVVDNFSESTQPFTLDWTLTGGCTLGCTPLPTELTDFSVTHEKGNAVLSITTASERSVENFIIDVSRDGAYWQEVDRIKANGNSSVESVYQAVDEKPFFGTSYYRLSEVNMDGSTKILSMISTEYFSNSMEYILYPIPANKNLIVEGTDLSSCTFVLQNSIGEIVETEKTVSANKAEFSLESLKNGVYFLTIENNGAKKTERIIVTHRN